MRKVLLLFLLIALYGQSDRCFILVYDQEIGGSLLWTDAVEQDFDFVSGSISLPSDLMVATELWIEMSCSGSRKGDGRIRYTSESTALRRETPDDTDETTETMATHLQIGREGETDDLVVNSPKTGFGVDTPNERVTVAGAMSMQKALAVPSATPGFGKVYVDDADGHLYYMDDSGAATDLLETTRSSGGGSSVNSIFVNPIHVCTDEDIFINSNLNITSPPTTHLWTGDTSPLSATDTPNPIFNASSPGNYNLSYTFTDGDGYTTEHRFVIIVHASPSPSITASPSTGGCEGEPVLLSGDGCFEKYCWNPLGPCTKVYSVTESGTYEVTVRDQWGCSGTASYTVTFLDPPSANAGVNVAACAGGTNPTIGGTPTASGGVAPYFYNWTGSGTPYLSSGISSNPTFDVSSAAPGVYSLSVEVTDGNGCSNIDGPILVTVRDLPTVSATATTPVCPGDDIELSGGATGGTAPYSYNWTGPNGFTSFIQSPTVSGVTAVNAGTYTLTVTDVFGCPSSTAAAVVVDIPPSIDTAPSDAFICQGLDASFSVVADGTSPFTYQWQRNTGGGFVDITGATSSSHTVSSITPAMDGYQYRCIVTGVCSPSVTSSYASLNVLLAPTIITNPSDQAVDETFPATFSVSVSGAGTLSYQWQQSTDGGSSWSNVGTDSDSYSTGSTTESMDGYQYRCIASGDCSPSDTSTAATLTVITDLFAFTSHTFTNCGATGRTGPSVSQCRSNYTTSWDEDPLFFNVTSGIQEWTVPADGTYIIEAYGAQGGGANGGLGARMSGEFVLTMGDVIHIIVGQQGLTQSGEPYSVGGGGGSFVVKESGTTLADIYVIAGGGGGSPGTYSSNRHAPTSTSGNNGQGAYQSSSGGTSGSGGSATDRAGAGGGFFTNGQSSTQTAVNAVGGFAFINGGNGGTHASTGIEGSFGGGGAAWQTGYRGSGGGGGYSGGGTGTDNTVSTNHSGGGGGSYNSGASQSNSAGVRSGNGQVTITKL